MIKITLNIETLDRKLILEQICQDLGIDFHSEERETVETGFDVTITAVEPEYIFTLGVLYGLRIYISKLKNLMEQIKTV
jgi:hypothetical protein